MTKKQRRTLKKGKGKLTLPEFRAMKREIHNTKSKKKQEELRELLLLRVLWEIWKGNKSARFMARELRLERIQDL